jgi:hypothetical protein
VVPPQWRESSIDHHDHVFPGERQHVTSAWAFIEFCTPGGGPQACETLHQVTVLELVPGGVCVIWVSLHEELLEVVHRRPHLTLVTMQSARDAPNARAAYHPLVAVIMVGHDCGPMMALHAPLLAAVDALLSTMDGDIR